MFSDYPLTSLDDTKPNLINKCLLFLRNIAKTTKEMKNADVHDGARYQETDAFWI